MTDGPRIALIVPDLALGGAQRVMLTFADHLTRLGARVEILALGRDHTLAETTPAGVAIVTGGARRSAAAAPWLVRALRARRPDAIVATPAYINFLTLALKPVLGPAPVFVREANAPTATLDALPAAIRRFDPYRRLYPRAAGVFAQTRAIQDALQAAAPDAKVVLLPNPTDVDALRKRAAAPRRVTGAGARLIAAGRLTAQKNFGRLVAAVAAGPADTHLTIFGDGPERATLAADIAQRGLTARVHLAGRTADLPAWLAGADALVLSSLWEGLPNVALEALAVGTPVVGTSGSGLADLQIDARDAVTIAEDGFTDHLAAIAPDGHQSNLASSKLPLDYDAATVAKRLLGEISKLLT